MMERALFEEKMVADIVHVLKLKYIEPDVIRCFFTDRKNGREMCRIYGVRNNHFGFNAIYTIEIFSDVYKYFSEESHIKALLHEIMHIPKSFNGNLRDHTHIGTTLDDHRLLTLFDIYQKRKQTEQV